MRTVMQKNRMTPTQVRMANIADVIFRSMRSSGTVSRLDDMSVTLTKDSWRLVRMALRKVSKVRRSRGDLATDKSS